ncbi:hypothetical protein Trydic_g8867 [Trypoxylus dichotomus]
MAHKTTNNSLWKISSVLRGKKPSQIGKTLQRFVDVMYTDLQKANANNAGDDLVEVINSVLFRLSDAEANSLVLVATGKPR